MATEAIKGMQTPINRNVPHNMKLTFCFFIVCSLMPTCYPQVMENNGLSTSETKEKWRALADEERYHEAISILLDSLQNIQKKNKHANYWHIGQLYACNNEYNFAVKYMKKSTNFLDKLFDREWRLYLNGTLAFLKRNQPKLKVCNDKLLHKHSDYYKFNVCTLNALYENYDKPYKLAYRIDCK